MSKTDKLVLTCLLISCSGWCAYIVDLIAPVHEIGHLVTAWLSGSRARITGWTTTSVEHPTVTILIAGHYFEGFLYTTLVLLLRKKYLNWASFIFGLANCNFLSGMWSQDFDRVQKMGATGIYNAWGLFNAVVLTVGWIVMIIAIWKRAQLINDSDSSDKRPATVGKAA